MAVVFYARVPLGAWSRVRHRGIRQITGEINGGVQKGWQALVGQTS